MIDLRGRVALVTGSSRGIGAGIARVLASYGADIAINHLNDGECAEEVSKAVAAMGRRVVCVDADVTDSDAVRTLVSEVEQRLGMIDILVNNAGGNRLKSVMDLDESEWDATLSLNLKSHFLCAKAVLPKMVERGQGWIIGISSISGQRGGLSADVDYSAAKAGILGFTRALARWAAPRGIRVNAIAPGYVATGWEQHQSAARLAQLIETIPLKRMAEPEEIGEIAAFLCGPGGNYIIGEVITANGGVHIA